GDIKTVDIHEHPEAIHFGVDTGDDPRDLTKYSKTLRNIESGKAGTIPQPLAWRSQEKRSLDIADLATKGKASNSAQFGVAMIEGVDKVRFIKQN
ncbi:MAG TPA: hypothetical protein VIT00_07650, partial [Terrimicrobiaceae bacterium]